MSRQVMVLVRVVGEPGGGPCLSATCLLLRIELEVPSDTTDISARVAQALVSSSGASILSRVVHDHGHGLVDSWAGWRDVTDALARREREMRSVVACPSQQLVQAGLFDRRAQAAAEARQRMDDGVEQETRSRIEQLIARTNVQVRVEVVAIHFGDLVPE